MKAVFALRADAVDKPGGDTSKVRRYASGLQALGWETETVTSAEKLLASQPDVIHILNLDLPAENLRLASIAKKLRVPYVLSTICHPYAGIEGMYHSNDDAFYRACLRISLSSDRAISMREQLKLLKRGRLRNLTILGSYHRLQQELIAGSSAILPMATGEEHYLRERFEIDSIVKTVRNGNSFMGAPLNPLRDKTFDLISVGRIEPRKNSLALAKAASTTGLKTAFVGALNRKHGGFCTEFESVIAQSSNLSYLGPIAHERLPEVLASADTYINAAWFEVVSQADVEAATTGLRIITTKHGYSEDALGSGIARIDPRSLHEEDAASTLLALYARAELVTDISKRNWSESASDLDEVYREVLGYDRVA